MKIFPACPLAVLLAFLLALSGCAAGFWRQCIDVDAKGLYSVSELGILGIGVLRYQRNTAQCKENESPEPAKLPTVKGGPNDVLMLAIGGKAE